MAQRRIMANMLRMSAGQIRNPIALIHLDEIQQWLAALFCPVVSALPAKATAASTGRLDSNGRFLRFWHAG